MPMVTEYQVSIMVYPSGTRLLHC